MLHVRFNPRPLNKAHSLIHSLLLTLTSRLYEALTLTIVKYSDF